MPALLVSPAEGLDEAMIEKLVRVFYRRIRADPTLAPIFEDVIGPDWEPHLQKMFAFWSSVMLMSGRYKGQPVVAHKKLTGVTAEHFSLWLELFEQTAREICPAQIAETFISKAGRIAQSLQLAMFFNPAEISR